MKKTLIGSYILVIFIIIYAISNHRLLEKKDFKAIEAGEKVYMQKCASCHGLTGKGEGANVGTALNNQQFLNSVSNEDLYNQVKYGREGTLMPSYSSMADKEIKQLVAYMRNWQTQSLKQETPKEIEGDAINGEKVYGLYCLSCHGENGAGKQKMGTALGNGDYLKYTSDKQIWIATAYGRENTRMGPSLKGLDGVRQLSTEQLNDVVAYIRSLEK